MFWVVCYDIPSNKRRRKIMQIMEGHGHRVQYSVFECDLKPDRLEQLVKRLRLVIQEDEDDVRFYPLNEGDVPKIITLGRATLERIQPSAIV